MSGTKYLPYSLFDYHFLPEPTSSLGPITVNCSNAHSTTSPKSSPNQVGLLTTASAPLSPPEDDISVTASPTPSPQPPNGFSGVVPPSIHNNHLFNNALAASLFLNAPLLPPPGQWLYSQFYPHDWPWMSLRNHGSLLSGAPRLESPKDLSQNPDSSSSIDITDVEERKEETSEDERLKERKMARKASVMLVRQREEVSSSDKIGSKATWSSSGKQSDVWRPY